MKIERKCTPETRLVFEQKSASATDTKACRRRRLDARRTTFVAAANVIIISLSLGVRANVCVRFCDVYRLICLCKDMALTGWVFVCV